MKRKLHPRVDEHMTYVGVMLYDSIYDEIESIRHVQVTTKSEVVRTLLIEALRARGRVLTAAEMLEAAA